MLLAGAAWGACQFILIIAIVAYWVTLSRDWPRATILRRIFSEWRNVLQLLRGVSGLVMMFAALGRFFGRAAMRMPLIVSAIACIVLHVADVIISVRVVASRQNTDWVASFHFWTAMITGCVKDALVPGLVIVMNWRCLERR